MQKSKRRFIGVGVASVLLVLAAAGSAWAGFHGGGGVSINTQTRTAQGTFGSAYNSSDSNQYIGCMLTAFSTTGTIQLSCTARDAVGMSVTCTSSSAPLIQAAASLNDEANLQFQYDASGNCTMIKAYHFSWGSPKFF